LHVTEGEEPDSLRTRAAIFLEAVGSGLVDLYVANSNAAVEFLTRGGVPRAKFVVIPNGIDSTLWASTGAHREASRIVCVANFRPIKRLPDVVDAVAVLKARGVHATCVFVGDGPLRSAVQARARSAGVDDRIEFMGQQPPEDVAALLDGAGVFVLASLWEGMPVSVMEAMSMGLPVVATDVPGIQELVVQGETGWLVPSRNPEQLADGLMSALANPEKARRMGQAGRVRVEKIFSLDRMIDRHAATYRSLVGGES
jgi:glycosyltransferase involved in cell wall biosynthesis